MADKETPQRWPPEALNLIMLVNVLRNVRARSNINALYHKGTSGYEGRGQERREKGWPRLVRTSK